MLHIFFSKMADLWRRGQCAFVFWDMNIFFLDETGIIPVSSRKLFISQNTKKRISMYWYCVFSYFKIWIIFQMKRTYGSNWQTRFDMSKNLCEHACNTYGLQFGYTCKFWCWKRLKRKKESDPRLESDSNYCREGRLDVFSYKSGRCKVLILVQTNCHSQNKPLWPQRTWVCWTQTTTRRLELDIWLLLTSSNADHSLPETKMRILSQGVQPI